MSKAKIIHFTGLGGIGISALARWFKTQGYIIQGSDLAPSLITRELEQEGIKITIGPHSAAHISKKIDRLIYSQAIQEQNPERQAAKKLHIPQSSYPQSVGELTKLYKTIAIAGAHGKSTTTALVALILQEAKFDPTVIIGTRLKEFNNKNFREGKNEYLVLEADEWKASFLHYLPYAALVTNVDREHLDYYKNLPAIKKAFLQFIHNVNPEGFVVLNQDNNELKSLESKIKRPIVWYSKTAKEAGEIKKILKLPGAHNLSNAIGAYTLARALGIKKQIILKAISSYAGAWRRNEYRGVYNSTPVYDDYGHHPTEIAATLAGFREQFPNKKIICVFQPHQRERLKLLFKNFTTCFNDADELILWDVYDVAGREEEKNPYDSQALARAIERRTKKSVPVVSDIKELKSALFSVFSPPSSDIRHPSPVIRPPSSVIVMMGAGNINEQTEKLID